MSARVERESGGAAGDALAGEAALAPPALAVAAVAFDPDADPGHHLPSDHPAWSHDVRSLSSRARVLVATLKPIVIRVLTYWDHRIRTVDVGGRTLAVDPSGSYRLGR